MSENSFLQKFVHLDLHSAYCVHKNIYIYKRGLSHNTSSHKPWYSGHIQYLKTTFIVPGGGGGGTLLDKKRKVCSA